MSSDPAQHYSLADRSPMIIGSRSRCGEGSAWHDVGSGAGNTPASGSAGRLPPSLNGRVRRPAGPRRSGSRPVCRPGGEARLWRAAQEVWLGTIWKRGSWPQVIDRRLSRRVSGRCPPHYCSGEGHIGQISMEMRRQPGSVLGGNQQSELTQDTPDADRGAVRSWHIGVNILHKQHLMQ